MLERSRICAIASHPLAAVLASGALALAGCATSGPPAEPAAPVPASAAGESAPPKPAVDPRALEHEARALLAQAETDIQRARARRALWTKAWESLAGARAALAAGDSAAAIRLAERASELAQLGLEQLAYPPVSLAPGVTPRPGTPHRAGDRADPPPRSPS
jgi:hypothetical protein